MEIVYRYLAAAGVAAMLCIVVAIKAMSVQRGLDDNKDLRAQVHQDQLYQLQVKRGDEIEGRYLVQKDIDSKYSAQALQGAASDIHPIILTQPSMAGVEPVPMLTDRAVCLFNDRWTGPAVPAGGSAAGADDGSACAAADAKGASAFDIRDALYSDAVNAGICRADITQLRALIEYERGRTAGTNKH